MRVFAAGVPYADGNSRNVFDVALKVTSDKYQSEYVSGGVSISRTPQPDLQGAFRTGGI